MKRTNKNIRSVTQSNCYVRGDQHLGRQLKKGDPRKDLSYEN